MIRYQLPCGRTIQISLDAFLRMSDDELGLLNESHIGACSSNPFDQTLEEPKILDEESDLDIED